MASTETREWTCADCGVVARFDRPGVEKPDGWAKDGGQWRCLGCRREKVITDAMTTPDDAGRAATRHAIAEFELLRDPDASDGQVAKRAKTSPAIIRPIRAELRASGRLPDPDATD